MILDEREKKLKTFDGIWENDMKMNGTFTYKNGDEYEGPLHKDEPHGKGVLKFHNEDVYDGDFEDGWIQGSGTYTLSNGTRLYAGQWKEAKKHGFGKFT